MKQHKESVALFENQEQASRELLSLIPNDYFDADESIVMSVSNSGLHLASNLALGLSVPMNILLSEPIYAPNNSELVIAMVSETEEMVMHNLLIDSFGIDKDYIYSEAHRQYEESVLSHVYKYRKGIPLQDLRGKHVILVDECIETGLTMMVALKSMIEMNVKSVYIAVPILDKSVYQTLLTLCDGIFCPHQIEDYISIEYYYKDKEILDFSSLEKIIKNSGILEVSKQKKE